MRATGNSIPVVSPFGHTSSPFSFSLTRVPSGSSINANVQLMTKLSVATSIMTSFSESQPVCVPSSQSFPPIRAVWVPPTILICFIRACGSTNTSRQRDLPFPYFKSYLPFPYFQYLIGNIQPVEMMVLSISQGPSIAYRGRVAHGDPIAIVSNTGVDFAAFALVSLQGHPPSAIQTITTISG